MRGETGGLDHGILYFGKELLPLQADHSLCCYSQLLAALRFKGHCKLLVEMHFAVTSWFVCSSHVAGPCLTATGSAASQSDSVGRVGRGRISAHQLMTPVLSLGHEIHTHYSAME